MKRPKKEGNKHLQSAFTIEELNDLQLRLEQESGKIDLQLLLKICTKSHTKTNGLEQIAILKEVGNGLQTFLSTSSESRAIEITLDSLAYLFVKCKSKHLARRVITSIFHSLMGSRKQVIQHLTTNLLHELKSSSANKDGNCYQTRYRSIIETVLAFTENFPLGKQVLKDCNNEVLKFLMMVLSREIINARSSTSLDVQSIAMSNCLAALKAIISVLHCDSSPEKLEITTHGRLDINLLCEVLQCCLKILLNDDFMLDGRSAAGVAVVALLQILFANASLFYITEQLLTNRDCTEDEFIKQISLQQSQKRANFEDKISKCALEKLFKVKGCRSSRLILCHGLITKLDSQMLHGMERLFSVPNESTQPGISSVGPECVNGESSNVEGEKEHDLTMELQNSVKNLEISPSNVHLNSDGSCSSKKVTRKAKMSLFTDLILNTLLDICSTVNEKGLTVYAFRTFFCWASEAYNHCKSMLEIEADLADLWFYSPSNEATPKLLHTLNGYLDHPVDAVRHQVRNALEKVIKIINLFPDSEAHINTLLGNWLLGNLKARSKCLSLICVLDHVSAKKFLQIRKSVAFDLLDCLKDCNLSTCICDLYVKLAACHLLEISKEESPKDVWVRTWCEPVFKAISSADSIQRTYITDYVVPGLLKAFPGLIHLILEKSRDLENSRDYVITTVVFLSCARGLRECSKLDLGLERVESACYWHGLVRMEFMELCLCHIDEQVRLDCLALICESNKSTEVLQQQDFQLLRFFLPFNMTSQSPKFRSRLVCCLKKAVSRMTDRCKQIRKLSEDASTHSELINCKAFIKWLLEFLFSGLHPAANFPRTVTALDVMATVVKVISQVGPNGSDGRSLGADDHCQDLLEGVFSNDRIKTLIGCLRDSFDVNRSLANEILMILPSQAFSLTVAELSNLFEEGLKLAYSPQPDDSNSTSEVMKFLANGSIQDLMAATLSEKYRHMRDTSYPTSCFYYVHLFILKILLANLNEQLVVAESDLSKAALEAPLHGTLQCMRQLLRTVKIQDVRCKATWQSLIKDIIEVCLRVTSVVGPVIQSNAPEGSLDKTGDHNVLAAEFLGHGESTAKLVDAQAHLSQILLVCCWRSMKEAVLLLGDIVYSIPVYEELGQDEREADQVSQSAFRAQSLQAARNGASQEQSSESSRRASKDRSYLSEGLLSSNVAVEIGNVFIDILLSSRHVGAFELAYLGFVKVCESFWQSTFESLKGLPAKWIDDLLVTLQSESPLSVLCSTRRSAGIPLYISAICSTEPSINKRRSLHFVMKVLVDLSRSVSNRLDASNNDVISQKVITLNILRAMFRDSKFGEDVFPYASDGLIIAIKGFSSDVWAIRNACTLLFSALMSRVFGVRKFPMSGTEFFSRFPAMYSFMKTEIEDVAKEFSCQGDRIHLHPSVFPLLLLLSHLYPSSMDGNDSKLKLRAFVPHIQRCGDSSVHKTRTMAARALASIVTPGELVETLQSLIRNLPTDAKSNEDFHNRTNGCLLQVRGLLCGKMADSNLSKSLRRQIIDGPLVSLVGHVWILSRENLCSFNKAYFFRVVNETVMELNEEDWGLLTNDGRDSLIRLIKASFHAALDELRFSGASCSQGSSLQSLMTNVGHGLLRTNCSTFLQLCCKDHNLKCLPDGSPDVVKARVVLALLESDWCDVRQSVLQWLCNGGKSHVEEGDVVSCLQKRLLEDETDIECIAEVCNALFGSSRAKTFPWILACGESYNCIQVWKCLQVKFQPNRTRESLQAAVQRLTTILVSGLHAAMNEMDDAGRSAAHSCLTEMFDYVSGFCQPEQSYASRMEAAKVVASQDYIDFMTGAEVVDSGRSGLAFRYWKCILDLIQDEDADIRCLVSDNIFPFVSKHYPKQDSINFSQSTLLPPGFRVQPSYMLQIIIKSLCGMYASIPVEVFNFFMSLLLGTSDIVPQSADLLSSKKSLRPSILTGEGTGNATVVFEEGEVNPYKEDLTLGHIVFEELQTMIYSKSLGLKSIDSGFVPYITMAIDEYIRRPSLFSAESEMAKSCQIIMGFCILMALDKDGVLVETRRNVGTFCSRVDLKSLEGFTMNNSTFLSHLRTAKLLCGE